MCWTSILDPFGHEQRNRILEVHSIPTISAIVKKVHPDLDEVIGQ